MKVLIADHPSGQMQITQRWIDGVRYLKVTPSSLVPLILEKLKQQFMGKPVGISVSETGWIRIEKKDKIKEFEQIATKATGKKKVSEDDIINKEAEMLRQQGFAVRITEE